MLLIAFVLRLSAFVFGATSRGEYLAIHHNDWPVQIEPPRIDRQNNRTTFQLADGESFTIDHYEYPNTRGTLPLVDIRWEHAQQLCDAEGGRLCTRKEWQYACSTSGQYRYSRESYSPLRVGEECNIGSKHGRLLPSGTMPECSNRDGMHEMFGNAWEWTAEDMPYGMHTIVGSAWNVKDDYAPTCRGFYLVRDAQWHIVDTQAFGFRCCYD